MERQQEGVVAITRVSGDQIAGRVPADGTAERTKPGFEFFADGLFLAGWAVDGYKIKERLQETIAVNVIRGPVS
jgi:hypothetical protein